LHLTDEQENAVAKKNVRLYLLCQALGASSAPINIALGGIVGSKLLGPDKSLATAPVTAYNIGVAIGALYANWVMKRVGRKRGFMLGTIIGVIGLILTGLAITIEHFWYFCGALTINGIASGFVQQYRFAAADRGTKDFKPKAISTIMLGGVAAAIIGPQIVIYASGLATPYSSAFYMATSLFILSFMALLFLNPSNLANQESVAATDTGRPLLKIVMQPRFLVAVFCGTSAYGLMSFVMTGAPLAMQHHGHSEVNATLGIQWHVMAMFAPSFFTGHLIAKFGKETIVSIGMVILIACGMVALAGLDLMHFWGSLVLLGIGWNFGFIGATSMVTDTYAPEEKNKAQGANDFIIFGSVAFASLMSGKALNAYGWDMLNWIIFPVSGLALVSLLWLKYQSSKSERKHQG
jgi:MFS family permease